MSFEERLGTGRLRQVAVYFGLADQVHDGPPTPRDPPTWRYSLVAALVIAGVLGLAVGLRRTPELGVGWALVVVAAMGLCELLESSRLGVARRHPVGAEFATTFLLQTSLFSGISAAWNTELSAPRAALVGVLFGVAMGAFRAREVHNERRELAAAPGAGR